MLRPRTMQRRAIFSANSSESTDSTVLTVGRILLILLLCSWPIKWNGMNGASLRSSGSA